MSHCTRRLRPGFFSNSDRLIWWKHQQRQEEGQESRDQRAEGSGGLPQGPGLVLSASLSVWPRAVTSPLEGLGFLVY